MERGKGVVGSEVVFFLAGLAWHLMRPWCAWRLDSLRVCVLSMYWKSLETVVYFQAPGTRSQPAQSSECVRASNKVASLKQEIYTKALGESVSCRSHIPDSTRGHR
jgi:hypothetical protein